MYEIENTNNKRDHHRPSLFVKLLLLLLLFKRRRFDDGDTGGGVFLAWLYSRKVVSSVFAEKREREREREDALFVCVLEELLISSCA